ncbi:hypothetical protein NDA07_03400, partial [Microcoleus vaginatus DQ-U2]|uniref:hypothetical protein n=1 Tax=Microcoleus vaginatus TaxID=119532 RepID=UPI001A7E7E76
LFVWIGKRVTILLPIFFYHKLAQALLTMGWGLVVTPPAAIPNSSIENRKSKIENRITVNPLDFPLPKGRSGGLTVAGQKPSETLNY